jgi:hypothetical protein
MRTSVRDDRPPPRRYEAARVELYCPVTATHARSLSLEHATLYTDGRTQWAETDPIIAGYAQAGRCCDTLEVSAL